MTGAEFLKNAWRATIGLPPIKATIPLSFKALQKTEWSSEFEQLMRNRLIAGAFRYGVVGDPTKGQFNRIEDSIRRLKAYQRDGNTEHLVDAANLSMMEFLEGIHPKKHFKALDIDAQHCERV